MADKTAILSVGIDVGTSTTQVVFSKLQMDNAGGYFSVPRVAIVDKEVVYKSEVYMTPLKTDVLIDTDALRDIVAAEFRKAGYRPEDTDSGAVIITGESARKENSDAVLKSLSDFAGDFVVSAAGPDMESLIAGKGSGAWQYSMDHHCRVANLDIGGGTTNVVLFEDGEIHIFTVFHMNTVNGHHLTLQIRLLPDHLPHGLGNITLYHQKNRFPGRLHPVHNLPNRCCGPLHFQISRVSLAGHRQNKVFLIILSQYPLNPPDNRFCLTGKAGFLQFFIQLDHRNIFQWKNIIGISNGTP